MMFIFERKKSSTKKVPEVTFREEKRTNGNQRNESTNISPATSPPASRAKDPRAPATSAKVAGEALVGLGARWDGE